MAGAPGRRDPARDGGGPDDGAASRRPARRRSSGISVVAGGLLQDLEDRLRRDLAPVEERVRPGEEMRGLAAGAGGGVDDPLVIVLPAPGPGIAAG